MIEKTFFSLLFLINHPGFVLGAMQKKGQHLLIYIKCCRMCCGAIKRGKQTELFNFKVLKSKKC